MCFIGRAWPNFPSFFSTFRKNPNKNHPQVWALYSFFYHALRKEFHAHDIFGNQGMSPLPWLPKNMDGTGETAKLEPTITPHLQHSRTPSAYKRFLRIGYQVCIFHTRTHRSSGVARWVGWLGARSAVFGGCFQLWRGGESAVAWWQRGDTSLAPPGMILVLAKKAE